jgi:hypothetical protein
MGGTPLIQHLSFWSSLLLSLSFMGFGKRVVSLEVGVVVVARDPPSDS